MLTYKYQDNKFYVPSSHFADGSPAFRNDMGSYSGVGRLTWAASSKDKIRLYVEKQFNGEFYNGFNTYATDDARSVHRCLGPRLDPAGAVDARAIEQAPARSRHRRTTTSRTNRTAGRA